MSWQLPKAECLIFHLRLHFSKLNLCIVLTAEKFCIWHVCKPAIHLHLYLSEELLLHFLRRVTLWADWPLNSSRSVLGPFLIHRSSRAHSSLYVYFHWPCWVVCLIHCSSSSLDPSVADTQGFYFYSSSLSLGNTNLLCVCYHGTSKYSLIQGPTLAQMLTGQKYMITPTGVIYFFSFVYFGTKSSKEQQLNQNQNCLLPGFHYLAEELQLLNWPIQLGNDLKRVNSLFLRR